MNWTIFFAILILICLFARPAWWILCCIIKTVGRVINYFIQHKEAKGGDRYDVVNERGVN